MCIFCTTSVLLSASCQFGAYFSGAKKCGLKKDAAWIRCEKKRGGQAYLEVIFPWGGREHIHISGYCGGLPHLNARFRQRRGATQRPDPPVPKVRQMHLAGMVM